MLVCFLKSPSLPGEVSQGLQCHDIFLPTPSPLRLGGTFSQDDSSSLRISLFLKDNPTIHHRPKSLFKILDDSRISLGFLKSCDCFFRTIEVSQCLAKII